MNLPDEVIEEAAATIWNRVPLLDRSRSRRAAELAATTIASYAYEQGREDARAEIRVGIDALYGTEDANEVGDGYDNGILAALSSLDSTGEKEKGCPDTVTVDRAALEQVMLRGDEGCSRGYAAFMAACAHCRAALSGTGKERTDG